MKNKQTEFLKECIPVIDNHKILSYILFLLVTFTYKGTMLLIAIPLFLLIKKSRTENIKEILYVFGFYAMTRILFSMTFGNISMQVQGLRMLLGVNILLAFLSSKKIKGILSDLKRLLKKEQILAYIFVMVFAGCLWNMFSSGGIKSGISYFKNMQIFLLCFLGIPYIKLLDKLSKLFFITIIISTILCTIEIALLLNSNKIEEVYANGKTLSLTVGIVSYSYLLIQLLLSRKIFMKVLYLCCIFMWWWITLISGARGSAIAFLVSSVVSIVLICKKKSLLYFPVVLVLLFFMLSSNNSLSSRFKYLLDGKIKDNVSYGRIALMKAGMYTFKNNIIFGAGYNNTQKYFIEYKNIYYSDKNNKSPLYKMNQRELENFPDSHNIIVDYLATLGIFGLFLSGFFILYIPLISLLDYFKMDYIESLVCFVSFLSFSVGGMTWSILTRHTKGISFLMMLLLLLICRRNKCQEK
ncbi:O-antigen ligase family protein [Fusobacterium sp. PH5-44]|uniref:O-antigen ligase family protein n=1 Tax=unclassified Fusobacterium TaxID=2648384 RepID=UPI003D25D026